MPARRPSSSPSTKTAPRRTRSPTLWSPALSATRHKSPAACRRPGRPRGPRSSLSSSRSTVREMEEREEYTEHGADADRHPPDAHPLHPRAREPEGRRLLRHIQGGFAEGGCQEDGQEGLRGALPVRQEQVVLHSSAFLDFLSVTARRRRGGNGLPRVEDLAWTRGRGSNSMVR